MKVIQYGRRRFLTGMTALGAATISSRLATTVFGAEPGWLAQLAAPPYEMLVLGDSVVWGQGLPEEKKFYSIVRDRLESEILHRRIRMVMRAHSGATIYPANDFFPRTNGEVPVVAPSLFAQVSMALDYYKFLGVSQESVSLVLLNGGINDMGFSTLINPLTTPQMVADKAQAFCFVGMKSLLNLLADKFPKALLVVTGYFPVISSKTDKNTLRDIVLAFLGIKPGMNAIQAAINRKAAVQAAAICPPATPGQWDPLFDPLNCLSTTWKERSDFYLDAAVNDLNQTHTAPPQGGTPGCNRAVFVKVEFAPNECYNAGPDSALWRITGPNPKPSKSHLLTDDLMFDARQPQCLANHLNLQDQQTCEVAGTGHPNVKGAKKYADAIMAKLSQCLLHS
jgi:lysophospholipase L1-like esterase